MSYFFRLAVMFTVTALLGCGDSAFKVHSGQIEEQAAEENEELPLDPPLDPGDKVLEVRVKVYLYSFEAAPEMNTQFSEQEVEDAMAVVNQVWSAAGIHFNVEVVMPLFVSATQFPAGSENLGPQEIKAVMARIAPQESDPMVWNVAIIRRFNFGAAGLYIGGKSTAYYTDVNSRNETHYTILAHELGHSLGLPHGEGLGNLMAPNPNPSEARQLTDEQISIARSQAVIGPKKAVPAD